MMTLFKKILIVFLLLFSIDSSAQFLDTIHLYYGIGDFKLDAVNKKILDSIVEKYSLRRILIYGHADYLGNEDPNQLLSDNRAKTVLRYLIDRGFPETQVMQAIGYGQTVKTKDATTGEGDPKSRRTDIFIINGGDVTAKTKPVPSPAPKPVKIAAPKPAPTNAITVINYDELRVGDSINMKNIGFYPGMPTILRSSYDEVNNLYEVLAAHPTLKIRLEGHVCCCVYPDGYFEDTPNWQLSVDRARTVRNILIGRGISPDRLEYVGFGRTRPILDNEINSERGQINRRVEIRVLEK